MLDVADKNIKCITVFHMFRKYRQKNIKKTLIKSPETKLQYIR